MTDTARKRNLFFICVGLAVLHSFGILFPFFFIEPDMSLHS